MGTRIFRIYTDFLSLAELSEDREFTTIFCLSEGPSERQKQQSLRDGMAGPSRRINPPEADESTLGFDPGGRDFRFDKQRQMKNNQPFCVKMYC